MLPGFAEKLGLHIYKTNVRSQKINGSRLKIFGIIIALFPMDGKDLKFYFF